MDEGNDEATSLPSSARFKKKIDVLHNIMVESLKHVYQVKSIYFGYLVLKILLQRLDTPKSVIFIWGYVSFGSRADPLERPCKICGIFKVGPVTDYMQLYITIISRLHKNSAVHVEPTHRQFHDPCIPLCSWLAGMKNNRS